jgi:hypothetical protein
LRTTVWIAVGLIALPVLVMMLAELLSMFLPLPTRDIPQGLALMISPISSIMAGIFIGNRSDKPLRSKHLRCVFYSASCFIATQALLCVGCSIVQPTISFN